MNTQDKIDEAIRNPKNLGEMSGADAVGTAGSSDCGDMLRMWIKFREEGGKRVIDKATFEKPHQLSVGVRDVFVNGTAVWRNNTHTGAKPGRAVYGPGWDGQRRMAATK